MLRRFSVKHFRILSLKFIFAVPQNVNMATKTKRVIIDGKPKYASFVAPSSPKSAVFTPNGLPSISEAQDANPGSSFSGTKLIRRSSMICSEGFDKYTYDCGHNDIPTRSVGLELDAEQVLREDIDVVSLNNRSSSQSDGEISPKSSLVKRDSVVHPGKINMQPSICINGRYQNPWPTWRPPTITNILKFGFSKDKSNVPSKQELDLVLPITKPNFTRIANPPDDGIRVTWIGHSTVLVQMHGLNVLTDPMFSDRASPSQVVGPKRYRDPPCSIHDLPHINAVVISHSHYDHLDFNTVTLLNARFGSDIRWFVPLGLLPWMQRIGCENVVELDWWEENCVPEHSDTFFVFTPAQHWSKRTISDDNKVLWGSWCILGPKYRFFFAGDTGYCEAFKQIGKVHGPFNVSAIPIGAFEPRWFMKYQHINPEEAVKIHIDVRSDFSLAIHWGTFCLSNEYYLDPPVKLRESLEKYNIPTEKFFTLTHGESRVVSQNSSIRRDPAKPRYPRYSRK